MTEVGSSSANSMVATASKGSDGVNIFSFSTLMFSLFYFTICVLSSRLLHHFVLINFANRGHFFVYFCLWIFFPLDDGSLFCQPTPQCCIIFLFGSLLLKKLYVTCVTSCCVLHLVLSLTIVPSLTYCNNILATFLVPMCSYFSC